MNVARDERVILICMVSLFARTRARTIAVVDIESGHVGCALISLSDKRADVISYARSNMTLEVRDIDHARARLAEEIAEVIKLVSEMPAARGAGGHVSEARVILRAPWTQSRVVAAKAASEKDMLIKATHVAKLLDTALTSAAIDRSLLFEALPLSVFLNGYPTTHPEGKRAHTVDLYAIASAADASAGATIQEAVHRGFPAARLTFVSAARVNAQLLPKIAVPGNCVIVDFGVQSTQLSVLREGILAGERIVADGLASIIAKVHGARPPEEMLSLFRMLARDACADEACAALQQSLAASEPELVKLYAESFAAFAEVKRLPATLVLLAHPDVAPWLEHFFSRIDFTQFTSGSMPFTVRTIQSDEFHEMLGGDLTLDPGLALAAAHATLGA